MEKETLKPKISRNFTTRKILIFFTLSNLLHRCSFMDIRASMGKKSKEQPWLGGSVGWSVIPYTKRLWVQFPVGAHTRFWFDAQAGRMWKATN